MDTRPRSRSLISPDEYAACYCVSADNFTLTDRELDYKLSLEKLSEPWPIQCFNSNGSSCSSTSDSLTDDSGDASYSPLEEKHFEDAINRGAFSEASIFSRRERRRSYNMITKKPLGDFKKSDAVTNDREFVANNDDLDLPQYMQRTCSLSEMPKLSRSPLSKERDSPRRRKSTQSKYSEKIRRKFSVNGIDFIDVTVDLSLEEIHELQQSFYSCANSPGPLQQGPQTCKQRSRSSSFL